MSQEIVSLIASWPTAVTLLGVAFLATQRKALSGLLDRATKVSAGPAAIEAAARAEQQQAEASKPTEAQALPAPAPVSAAPRQPPPNALYDSFDTHMRAQLDQAFGNDAELKLAWAIRLRSQVLVERMHETNYRAFFTSQIQALRQLNQFGNATMSQARRFYDEAASQNPNAYQHLSWENWSGFLRSTGYVQVGEGDDPTVTLTPLGADFIVWMAARRVLEVKQF